MDTLPVIPGIHHLTAVAGSAKENLDFYQGLLGLCLVKKTVNFDDPYTYHLYYGDRAGTPGTLITFFPWEDARRGRPGAGMITAMAMGIPQGETGYWKKRLQGAGLDIATGKRFGRRMICFSDPSGIALELIESEIPGGFIPWSQGPVEARFQIHGFHSATATVHDLDPIRSLLTGSMGMELVKHMENRYRFAMGVPGEAARYYDILVDSDAPGGRPGAGTVHHIAFRCRTHAEQALWQSVLRGHHYTVTEVRDRTYFKSIYFRSPGGVLFEMATDPPGFSIDEPEDRLGSTLQLPIQYEPMRSEIQRQLPRL